MAVACKKCTFFIFAFCEPLTGETNFLQIPYTFQLLKLKCLSRQLSVMLVEASFHTCVAKEPGQ